MPTLNTDVVKALQKVAQAHWTAIEYYTAAAKHLKRWGYWDLGKDFRKEAKHERHHLRSVIKRLEYGDNSVDFGHTKPSFPRHDVVGIIKGALALEESVGQLENDGAYLCRQNMARDEVSARLFGHLVTDTEATIEWLTAQLQLVQISELGPENWKQLQV